jgi:hypothetical protein
MKAAVDLREMRFLANIFGRLMFCFGLIIIAVGCVLGSTIGSTGGTMMSGITLMAVGGAIYWLGSTKVCPQCSKRVKHTALECNHCGGAQS